MKVCSAGARRNVRRRSAAATRARALIASVAAAGGALLLPQVVDAQRHVTFRTSDGGMVVAREYGRGAHAVVLVHGGRFTKESWEPQARAIADAGFRVLAIDLRGRGSSRAGSWGSDAAHLDVIAAVRFLRAGGVTSVSLVGASYGGWAAAEAATRARSGEIDRLVLLAHSPIEFPERLPGRKLFVISRDDTTGTGAARMPAVQRQFERAPEPKSMLVLDGAAHAQFLFDTDQGARLLRAIIEFLQAP